MAIGGSKGIRCVAFEVVGRCLKERCQHGGYLLLGRIAVAGDGLFDFFGEVFKNGDVSFQGRGNGCSLGPAQFDQSLDILSKKRGLDGQFIGLMQLDEGEGLLENLAKPQKMGIGGTKSPMPGIQKRNPVPLDS